MAAKLPRWLSLPVISALTLILIILLIYQFGNYRQERVVKNFLNELKAGDYQKAYQIWGPTQSYAFKDFMKDWGGASSYYGKVTGYRILKSKTRGNGVIIVVEFNHLKRPVYFWVDLKDLTMAFSPFADLDK
jgi:hypothetical protein